MLFSFAVFSAALLHSGRPSSPACLARSTRAPAARASAAPLLESCTAAGPVGVLAPEAAQQSVEDAAAALEGASAVPAQARVPLAGTYDLLYSAAKGGSNGKIGPFVGQVTQVIKDETSFVNQVSLGPLTVQLHATREVLDDNRIRVSFVETVFSLFGRELWSASWRPGGGRTR